MIRFVLSLLFVALFVVQASAHHGNGGNLNFRQQAQFNQAFRAANRNHHHNNNAALQAALLAQALRQQQNFHHNQNFRQAQRIYVPVQQFNSYVPAQNFTNDCPCNDGNLQLRQNFSGNQCSNLYR